VILALLGLGTYERSRVWDSEVELWRNAMQASPHNGRAIMRFGIAQLNTDDAVPALQFLRRADGVTPRDPLIEINLARTLERRSQTADAEKEFRNAISNGPSWSRGYSAYAEWLMAKTRPVEAQAMAKKALELDPYDNAARRTLMDVLAQDHQWNQLKQFADSTLQLEPGDPDGQRSLEVAQSGIDQIDKAAHTAKYEPTVNNYLALSVQYFNTHQYEDCIAAAKEALKINPNQAEAYANMASAYHTLGQLDESLAALREENRLDPNLPNAKANLAVVEAEIARRDAAKQSTSAQ
jgi:protein O-mannosyl-transferase